MKKKIPKAIQISIIPAFFASACCMTYPILIMLGFYVSESFFIDNKWNIRFVGLLILMLSLFFHFRFSGVRTIADFKYNLKEIFFMTFYTLFAFVVSYLALIYYFSPILCASLKINTCGV